MTNVFKKVMEYKNKYPLTVAFRLKKHSKVIETHLNPGEKILYAFCGQKNHSSFLIINSCVIVITDRRIMIGQKRLLWGYFYTNITPDLYNDLKIIKHIIWSNIELDTVTEKIYISNLDPNGAIEIGRKITEYMMEEKKKYGKENN